MRVGVEGFLARGGLYARGTSVRQELPALLVILEVCDHDLAENLLMHGCVEDRAQNLDRALSIGVNTSTLRSRLRGIMSADEM